MTLEEVCPNSQMGKLRPREVKWPVQSHTAGEASDNLALGSVPLPKSSTASHSYLVTTGHFQGHSQGIWELMCNFPHSFLLWELEMEPPQPGSPGEGNVEQSLEVPQRTGSVFSFRHSICLLHHLTGCHSLCVSVPVMAP